MAGVNLMHEREKDVKVNSDSKDTFTNSQSNTNQAQRNNNLQVKGA